MNILKRLFTVLMLLPAKRRAGSPSVAKRPRSWEFLATLLAVQAQAGSMEKLESGYLPGTARPEDLDMGLREARKRHLEIEARLPHKENPTREEFS